MKNIKVTLITLLMPAMLFGFGNLKVPGLGKAEAAVSTTAAAGGLQDALVRDYLTANSSIQKGQTLLLEAFGKKEALAKLEQGQDSLSGKQSTQDLKAVTAQTKEAQEAIAKSMEEGVELTEEGKAKYRESIPHMIQGAVGISKLAQTASEFIDSSNNEIQSAGLMGAVKLKKKLDAGLFVAPKIPGLIGTTAKNAKGLITYGKKNKILDADDQSGDALKGADGPA
jgi:hypothetical protein